MAGRYLVSGVQLGMLKALFQTANKNAVAARDGTQIIDEIVDAQFVGNSFGELSEDVKIVADLIK